MEPKESIVEETLKSLDGISRAEANPFLYSKVINRMNSANESRIVKPAVLRTAFVIAILLLSVNVFTLIRYSKSTETAASQNKLFQKEYFSYINNVNF